MSSQRRRASPFLVLFLAVPFLAAAFGCVAAASDDSDSTEGAATAAPRVLDAEDCARVKLPNQSTEAGTFAGPLTGCVGGKAGDSGSAMMARGFAIAGKPESFASVTDRNGKKMFHAFEPERIQGSLAAGRLTFDAKVAIDILGPFDAKGVATFTVEKVGANLSLTITNRTAIGAAGADVIAPNGLNIKLVLAPAQNGVEVTGSVRVTLLKFQSYAGNVSRIGPQIVEWLDRELRAR
jgi:hypothetical protein